MRTCTVKKVGRDSRTENGSEPGEPLTDSQAGLGRNGVREQVFGLSVLDAHNTLQRGVEKDAHTSERGDVESKSGELLCSRA